MQYSWSDVRFDSRSASTSTTTTLTMKLLIDTKSQRVVFAEAGKDVVDFLFSLLSLPMATVAKLVRGKSIAGSFGNLYGSVDKIDYTYMQTDAVKDALLSPPVSSAPGAHSCPLRLASNGKLNIYRCDSCPRYVADVSGTKCPSCHKQMTKPMSYVAPASPGDDAYSRQMAQDAAAGGAKGFVKGAVTYTVQDDLTVAPMSNISSISLFNTYAVKNLGDLQEKTVLLSYKEGVQILRASLQSKTVLTDVFLRK